MEINLSSAEQLSNQMKPDINSTILERCERNVALVGGPTSHCTVTLTSLCKINIPSWPLFLHHDRVHILRLLHILFFSTIAQAGFLLSFIVYHYSCRWMMHTDDVLLYIDLCSL